MVIKLNKIKRWLPIWKYLKNKWGVYVHFSDRHSNYYSAWLYTTKEYEHFIQSAGHPDLGNSGLTRTIAASQARAKRRPPIADLHDSQTDTTSGGEEEEGEERQQEGDRSRMTGKNDTPIFGTTKHDFVYVKGGTIDQMETEMMAVRWKAFQFQRQIPQNEQLSIQPCARCFAELILSQ